MTAIAPPARRHSQAEFVALTALLFSLLAFSMDAMLPGLPQIAAELTPEAPNRAALVLSAFVIAMGIGTLFTGPLSDAIGRKPVLSLGLALYLVGAALAWMAPSLTMLLFARALQGLGCAAPRVVSMAMVRDLYEGRHMAQIQSFVMMVFAVVPALAPSIGAGLMWGFGWRAIFAAFVVVGFAALAWLMLRQPETLPPEHRRPLTPARFRHGLAEVFTRRRVLLHIVILTLGFGQLFALIASVQQVYDGSFGRAAGFPLWFGASAVIAVSGAWLNSRLVLRLGMRRLALIAFGGMAVLGGSLALAYWLNIVPQAIGFPLFFLWSTLVIAANGMIPGNLTALALQPLGHVAGLAASVVAAVSTLGAGLIAAPLALAFDGTPRPLLTGASLCVALAWLLLRSTPADAPEPRRV